MTAHEHVWTKLWSHWGPYGPQVEHYHVCFDRRCGHVLIDRGRDCTSRWKRHHVLSPKMLPRHVGDE